MTRLPRGPDQLVAGIGNQRRAGIADQRDGLACQGRQDALAQLVVAMVVIGGHRRLRTDVRQQLRGDPLVLGKDMVGAAQRFGRT